MIKMTIIEEMFSDHVAVFGKSLELLVAILATITWKKYKNTPERNFIYYLWVTIIVEAPLFALLAYYYEVPPHWLYNLYYLFCFYFILNWFYRILKIELIKYLSYGVLVVFILNFFTQNFEDEHFFFQYMYGAVSILIASTFYYINLLKSNDIFHLRYKLSFWITTGFLLFYIGMIPVQLLPNISTIEYRNEYSDIILIALNVILYGCFITGLLLTKNTTWKKEI